MKKILVIEHERMIFLDIKVTFAKLGYEVIFGNMAAIEALFDSDDKPELIVMDVWTMMRMNGLLKFSINNYSKFRDIPVILTSTVQKGKLRFCMTNKITLIGELHKPYSSTDLLELYNQYQQDLEYPAVLTQNNIAFS